MLNVGTPIETNLPLNNMRIEFESEDISKACIYTYLVSN